MGVIAKYFVQQPDRIVRPHDRGEDKPDLIVFVSFLKVFYFIEKNTFNKDEVVDGFLETEMFNKEGLLFFVVFFEEVFEVAVPDFSDFGIERLPDGWHAHIYKNFAHEEIVHGNVGVFGAMFCGFEVGLD